MKKMLLLVLVVALVLSAGATVAANEEIVAVKVHMADGVLNCTALDEDYTPDPSGFGGHWGMFYPDNPNSPTIHADCTADLRDNDGIPDYFAVEMIKSDGGSEFVVCGERFRPAFPASCVLD